MAITVTNLLTAGSSANSAPYTTGTITPATDGSPILCIVSNSASAGRAVSAITGLGLTWTVVVQGAAFAVTHRGAIWQGVGTASTGTCDIAFGGSSVTGAAWSFIQLAGANKTTPIVSGQATSATGSGTGPTVNLASAVTSGNCAIGGLCVDAGITPTAGTGFTAFSTTYNTPNTTVGSEYHATSTSATVNWTIASNNWGITACEVAAAATGDSQFVGWVPL